MPKNTAMLKDSISKVNIRLNTLDKQRRALKQLKLNLELELKEEEERLEKNQSKN